MKVLFDSQAFDMQKYGGISRYFSELFKVFNKIKHIDFELPVRDSVNEYLLSIEPFKEADIRSGILDGIKGKFLWQKIVDIFDKGSNRNLLIKSLKKQEFDLFHPTYYSTYFLKYLKSKPFVLTIHDMIHEKCPQYFPFDINKTAICKKKLALKAEKIIAISENTKKDIIDFYGIPSDKIDVIYHGSPSFPLPTGDNAPLKVPSKYILYVGSRAKYKNFLNFIKAVEPLLKADKNLNVVAAGGYSVHNDFSKYEKKIFSELGVENKIFHYSINDEVLAYLYKNAICFVFPSLYEGFGMPILEAFSCDCPVLASNRSSLPEIGGDAVMYFNPENIGDISRAIKETISNRSLRESMILRGRDRLKDFSWKMSARKTLNLYQRILNEKI